MHYEGSTTQAVAEYVKAHPGCTRKDILDELFPGVSYRSAEASLVSNLMGRLKRERVIENRGGFAKHAAWYAIESETKREYFEIAEDLLNELKDVHASARASYLAKRLEEMFEGE